MTENAQASSQSSAWGARIAVLAGLALLLSSFARYFIYAMSALRSPHQRDYGEGIVWEQLRMMFEGKAYGPIDGFPAIVFHYPPLYYATVRGLSWASGWDTLTSGRIVSFAATLASALLIAMMGAAIVQSAGKRSATIAGAFAGPAAISLPLIEKWALVMRVDMLAIALGLAGMWFALRSVSQSRQVYLASLCFVAAMFTKQTSVAAPAAAFATLLLIKPKTAWLGIGASVAIGSLALLALVFSTHGGILNHLIFYNINRFDPANLWLVPAPIIGQILFFAVVVFGLIVALKERLPAYAGGFAEKRRQLKGTPQDAALLMSLLYLVAKTLMIAMIAKSGANVNYLAEWMFACAIFIAPAALVVVVKAVEGPAGSHLTPTRILVPLALGIPAIANAASIGQTRASLAERRLARDQYAQLSAMIREAPKPVISDDMVILLRNGKEVVWEPAIFAELASTGSWDERPLLTRIRGRRFSFFITEGGPETREFKARYTPAVAAAMAQAYPDTCLLSKYLIHLPAGSLPSGVPTRRGQCPKLSWTR